MTELSLKQKRFTVMQDYCMYRRLSRMDGEWVNSCKCPSIIPPGMSYINCETAICPFYKRLFPRERRKNTTNPSKDTKE